MSSVWWECKEKTTSKVVEVLYFRHYCKHYEFSIDETGYRQKIIKQYINVVSVCINLEQENTKRIDKMLFYNIILVRKSYLY